MSSAVWQAVSLVGGLAVLALGAGVWSPLFVVAGLLLASVPVQAVVSGEGLFGPVLDVSAFARSGVALLLAVGGLLLVLGEIWSWF